MFIIGTFVFISSCGRIIGPKDEGEYKIAYLLLSEIQKNSYDLHTADIDGTNDRLLANNATEIKASWDKNMILYVSNLENGSVISVVSPNALTSVKLTNENRYNRQPMWGFNGDIVYTSFFNGNSKIITINYLTSEETVLTTDSTAKDIDPSFLHNGEQIAFVSGNPGDIYIMNKNGENKNKLLELPGPQRQPVFSPNESDLHVYFTDCGKDAEDRGSLYRYSPVDETLEQLLKPNSDFSFSNNGLKITYSEGGNIWVMNSDGSKRTQLTDYQELEAAQSPSFSPDDKKIIYTKSTLVKISDPFNPDKYEEKSRDIFTMGSDGSNQEMVPIMTQTGKYSPIFINSL